jgi:hypothetical protein
MLAFSTGCTVVEIKEEAKLWSAAGAKHLAALVVPQLRE